LTGKFDGGPPPPPRRPETLSDLPKPQPQATPDEPAANAPDRPAPDRPAPDRPAPDRPAPDRSAPEQPAPDQPGLNEPTQTLPTVPPLKVAARAVIVYQEAVRRPWRLWVFTAVLVALTAGVVLGQSVAFEPTYRSNANANAAVVPAPVVPSPPAPTASWPDAAHRVTAPLGGVKTRTLVLAGDASVLRVRSADLGRSLYDIATTDRSAVPRVTTTGRTATLELIRTGDDGTVGADIQLNSRVAWTLELAGGLNEQSVDMQAGGLAALHLTGGSAHTAILLPDPRGTVPVSVKGPVADLTVSSRAGVPLRLKLTDGAGSAVVDGKPRPSSGPGTTITSAGWKKAANRYDVTTTGVVKAARIATTPPAR
jgi:hypothetical protein